MEFSKYNEFLHELTSRQVFVTELIYQLTFVFRVVEKNIWFNEACMISVVLFSSLIKLCSYTFIWITLLSFWCRFYRKLSIQHLNILAKNYDPVQMCVCSQLFCIFMSRVHFASVFSQASSHSHLKSSLRIMNPVRNDRMTGMSEWLFDFHRSCWFGGKHPLFNIKPIRIYPYVWSRVTETASGAILSGVYTFPGKSQNSSTTTWRDEREGAPSWW